MISVHTDIVAFIAVASIGLHSTINEKKSNNHGLVGLRLPGTYASIIYENQTPLARFPQ